MLVDFTPSTWALLELYVGLIGGASAQKTRLQRCRCVLSPAASHVSRIGRHTATPPAATPPDAHMRYTPSGTTTLAGCLAALVNGCRHTWVSKQVDSSSAQATAISRCSLTSYGAPTYLRVCVPRMVVTVLVLPIGGDECAKSVSLTNRYGVTVYLSYRLLLHAAILRQIERDRCRGSTMSSATLRTGWPHHFIDRILFFVAGPGVTGFCPWGRSSCFVQALASLIHVASSSIATTDLPRCPGSHL